jgi:hypothetical protein
MGLKLEVNGQERPPDQLDLGPYRFSLPLAGWGSSGNDPDRPLWPGGIDPEAGMFRIWEVIGELSTLVNG